MLAETYGNGLVHQLQYNSRLQTTEIKLGTSTASDSIFKLSYLYGTVNNPNDADGAIVTSQNNGNVGRIKYTINGALQYSQTYQYDGVNRLRYGVEHNNGTLNDASRAWYQTYAYDPLGNRGINVGSSSSNVTQGGNALQLSELSAASNRITRTGYGYDYAGNLTSEPGKGYTYDGENRLVVAVVGGATSSYWYDADGRRVQKAVAGVATRYVYNAAGQLIAEYTNTTGAAGSGGVRYVTTDHLGSTRLVTSGGRGDVKARYDY